MSMETQEQGDLEAIWAEIESLVADGDFDGAQECIDEAKEDGWVTSSMQEYLDSKTI